MIKQTIYTFRKTSWKKFWALSIFIHNSSVFSIRNKKNKEKWSQLSVIGLHTLLKVHIKWNDFAFRIVYTSSLKNKFDCKIYCSVNT